MAGGEERGTWLSEGYVSESWEMSSVLTVTAMPWFNCAFGESKR